MSTVPDAVVRIERLRSARIARLRDLGVAALGQPEGIATARRRLAEILLIARPGDPIAADLRERIVLAENYWQFRHGQTFTDGLENGARGTQTSMEDGRVGQAGGYTSKPRGGAVKKKK